MNLKGNSPLEHLLFYVHTIALFRTGLSGICLRRNISVINEKQDR
jgi:hypothetical protein